MLFKFPNIHETNENIKTSKIFIEAMEFIKDATYRIRYWQRNTQELVS
jgi:hypothetical protein